MGVFATEVVSSKNLSFAESIKSALGTVEIKDNKSDDDVFNSGCIKNSRGVGNKETKENKIRYLVKENNKITNARGSNSMVMAKYAAAASMPALVAGITVPVFDILLEKLKSKKETSKNESEPNTSEYYGIHNKYPSTKTPNKFEPKEQESSVEKVMRITLWSFFGVLLFPLIFIVIVALIKGGNGVRNLLLKLKLNKLWLILDALVAKFRYNWSLFPNNIFSNIPILYWYAGNCFLNAAFYMSAAPEYFDVFSTVSKMDTNKFIEVVGNAVNNKEKWSEYKTFWNSLGDKGRENEARRIIEIAKTCVTFLNFVAGKNKNIKEYEMKGKFSVVGKFNTWQFNEDKGSYRAKENELFTIKANKEEKLRDDAYYGGSIEDALKHIGGYDVINDKEKKYPPYFELLEEVMSNEENKKTVVEYEELFDTNIEEFGSFIIRELQDKYTKEGKVLVSIGFIKSGRAFTVQPKYEYNEKTKGIELTCWLALDCHGRSHKILHSCRELSDFLKTNQFGNRYILRYTDPNSITKDDYTKSYYLIKNENCKSTL